MDTDTLPIGNNPRPEERIDRLSDTARFDKGFGGEPVDEWVPYKRVHPYAEGVIRFYRARTIVTCDSDPKAGERAWKYLEPLTPHDLPSHVRPQFFELAFFVSSQTDSIDSRLVAFRRRVLEIAARIDEFMDALDAAQAPRSH